MFSALCLLVFCFLFFFEALVLATSLSFGNLVSRSCRTYFDKETTFSVLKISFSSSVSHVRQWLILLCHSTATAYFGIRGKLRGNAVRPLKLVQRMVDVTVFQPEDRSIFYNTSSTICCLIPVWSYISGFC